MTKGLDRWPLPAIRESCVECSGGSRKAVLWCSCDGLHSTRCQLWPFRFGMRPDTFRAKYGGALLTPEAMPDANVNLDHLPADIAGAVAYLAGQPAAVAG